MGFNITKGWKGITDNPITRGIVKGSRPVKSVGRDLVRDIPVVGPALGQKSSAERAAMEQTAALGKAEDYQRQMYGEAKGYLDPYQQMGQEFLMGKDEIQYKNIKTPFGTQRVPAGVKKTPGLADMIRGGEFVQDDFSYQGSQPQFNYYGQPGAFSYQGPTMASNVDYEGSQPGEFSYGGEGQQGQLDYSGQPMSSMNYAGGPVDRSISSYMEDDPGLAWQQEQLQKAIDRAGAAQGRWGGGATMRESMREQAGLLSQDYANRFNRAAMERGAQVGAETDRYGRALTSFDIGRQAEQEGYNRALTGLGLENIAEQSQYDRDLSKYGMDVSREQDAYSRALTDTNLGNLAAQDAFSRAQYGYETGVDREADAYSRAAQKYGYDAIREQNEYDRALQQYGLQGQNLQSKLNQYTSMANLGPQMAQTLANAAVGQGSSLSDLAIQQGNVNAASTMAGGNQLAKLIEMNAKMGENAKYLIGG